MGEEAEGEFKKRFKEIVTQHGYFVISTADTVEEADEEYLKQFMQIVGEVKKEFLAIQGEKSIQQLHKYYQGLLEKGDKLNPTAERIEWFVKWFGGNKQ